MTEPPVTRFRGDYFALSNFAPHLTAYNGVVYPTSEHAFVAAKTLDLNARAGILTMPTAQVKEIGRTLVLRPDWDRDKVAIMLEILRDKFTRNTGAATVLLGTGERDLIEGNTWHDNYWGRCDCLECQSRGAARNMLGSLLMQVRTELAANTRRG